MEIGSLLTLVFFVSFLLLFGRWISTQWNKQTSVDEAVKLPSVFLLILGKPRFDGSFNIRSIYLQLFLILYIFPLLLFNFDIISRQDVLRIFIISMVIFIIARVGIDTVRKTRR